MNKTEYVAAVAEASGMTKAQVKQMYLSGVFIKNIGKHFGVTSTAVVYRLTKLGIYQPYRNKGVA